jgi:hypothetical protein
VKKTITACAVTALLVGAGTATASKLITGNDIKDGSLTAADIRNGSLESHDLRDGEVKREDLSDFVRGQLSRRANDGKDGATGPQGPAGNDGASGATGATGPAGPAGRDAITEVSTLDGSQGWTAYEDDATATIEGGKVRLGSFPTGTDESAGVEYHGLNGRKLSDLSIAKFSVMSTGGDDHWLPYMYITTTEGNFVFIDPNYDSAPDPTFASGQWVTWDGLANPLVYRSPYANFGWNGLVAAHGDEVIETVSIGNGEEVRAAGTTSYLDSVELEVAGQSLEFDFVGGNAG